MGKALVDREDGTILYCDYHEQAKFLTLITPTINTEIKTFVYLFDSNEDIQNLINMLEELKAKPCDFSNKNKYSL